MSEWNYFEQHVDLHVPKRPYMSQQNSHYRATKMVLTEETVADEVAARTTFRPDAAPRV